MSNKQKLELTWIGKDKQPVLEPRILIEDPEKSYGDKTAENMLIFGDNLLALKALEQDFAGKIKCVYIDPPFNTGQAYPEYDDGIEHSLWLNMMYHRIPLLHSLLADDGALFIEIDDTESSYLQVILDDIFGRINRIITISIKRSAATGHKAINPSPINVTDFIHIYAKNKRRWKYNPLHVARDDYDWAYSTRLTNPNDSFEYWQFESLNEYVAKLQGYETAREAKRILGKKKFEAVFVNYALSHPQEVIRFAQPNYAGVSKAAQGMIDKSKLNPNTIFRLERENYSDMYFKGGNRILFLTDKVDNENGENDTVLIEPLTNFWDDVPWQGIAKEGLVDFPKNKKPERLIQRILEMSTKNGDIILDSFLGSGTTAAVAHKMGRRWIGIELGEHCHTHCLPRLKKVVDGTDQGGISKAVNWKGGGGFKYYYLAPSLLKEDKYGNWIIDERYNADMLAAAMAKHEGFRYSPDSETYWKQGKSTEKDYIFTTTQFITVEFLDKIHDELRPDESLLICCKSFSKACETRHANINVRKIPNMLLGRCEFGREDYSLNIVNMPVDNDAPDFVPTGPKEAGKKTEKPDTKKQRKLFEKEDDK